MIANILIVTFVFALLFGILAGTAKEESWINRWACLMWLSLGLWVFECCCLLIWLGLQWLLNVI